MEQTPHFSLIDLTKQLPFEIDDALKKEICFGETLIMSCCHQDGDIGDESSDSGWSCDETMETEASEEVKDEKMIEIKDKVVEDVQDEAKVDEEHDFHFYFFPDCNKPPPIKNSKDSILIVNGLPQINPASQKPIVCTCPADKKGNCTCFIKLPCHCGAKKAAECTCAKLTEICVCHEGKPNPVCTCKGSDVCVCQPGDSMRATCICEKVEKPCVCYADKFPCPVCQCKSKPKFNFGDSKSSEANEESSELKTEGEFEHEQEKESVAQEQVPEPCECQKPDPPPQCFCKKGRDCICPEHTCICGVRKNCVCETTDEQEEIACKSDDSRSICSCPDMRQCVCKGQPNNCKCFPTKICTCGDPVNCKCYAVCDCIEPCFCDVAKNKPKCVCSDQICTCSKKKKCKKLKKVRAGKHGYRWCHDVDPHHTYFDFGYDRHDKISYKEQERERFKVLGLYDEKKEEEVVEEETASVHEVKAPPYKKKIRKPSIDCCSAVGGISVSVETLGEDQDKFLVQIVSHSSKEGAKTGSKLVSILDGNLHTMEENRIEHITKKEMTKERRSYMAICENGYYNKVTRVCGDHNVVKRFYHTMESAKNFLLEGANVVFLRFLSLRRYRGNIKTDTVLMDGTICESVYVCLGVSQAIVNGKPLFVCKIERHIIEPTGYIHQTMTVLTLRGYMVSHEWADNTYLLHLNPLLNIVPEKDLIEPHAPLREMWREDMQLLSDYLDFKSARTSEGGRYVTENGALTGAVRDYLQALLLLRPHDALHFTQHYFSSALSAIDLPYDEFFDPSSKHVRYYFFEE